MIFVVDVGNSRIKWAFAVDGVLTAQGESAHPRRLSEFASKHWLSKGVPSSVIISNVAKPSLGTRISQWVVRHWQLEARFVTSERFACGVTNAYDEPAKLGSDRWAALIASRNVSKSPTVVVDCGTTVTIDVIDRSGKHRGGLILAGLEMMRGSLLSKTERIKFDDEEASAPELLANNTRTAVIGGTLYSVVASIDRITRDLLRELGPATVFLITGGDSAQLLPLLTGLYKHRPYLVLEGLLLLANEQSELEEKLEKKVETKPISEIKPDSEPKAT